MKERKEMTTMFCLSEQSDELIAGSKYSEEELLDWVEKEGVMIGGGMTMEFLKTKVKNDGG